MTFASYIYQTPQLQPHWKQIMSHKSWIFLNAALLNKGAGSKKMCWQNICLCLPSDIDCCKNNNRVGEIDSSVKKAQSKRFIASASVSVGVSLPARCLKHLYRVHVNKRIRWKVINLQVFWWSSKQLRYWNSLLYKVTLTDSSFSFKVSPVQVAFKHWMCELWFPMKPLC